MTLTIASLAFMAGAACAWTAARRYFSKPSNILSEPRRDRTIEDIIREAAE